MLLEPKIITKEAKGIIKQLGSKYYVVKWTYKNIKKHQTEIIQLLKNLGFEIFDVDKGATTNSRYFSFDNDKIYGQIRFSDHTKPEGLNRKPLSEQSREYNLLEVKTFDFGVSVDINILSSNDFEIIKNWFLSNFDMNNPDIRYADGGEVQLLAPNGKPSNLTPEEYKLVRTPEFKAWFGDWENDPENASKIVDDNGEPKVVYHGSRSQFTTFDLSKSGESNTLARVGFWFSAIEGFGLNFTAYTWYGDIKGDVGIEYAVFLSIKNPKVFVAGETNELFSDSYERFRTDVYAVADMSARDANIGGLGMAMKNPKQTIDEYRSMLKSDGYDGIVIKQTRFDKRTARILNDQIVALYPNQIKLADGSNTTFDPNNPDIRYADGGFLSQIIVCKGCGWSWDTSDSDESDKYVCHQCGFDNRTYYDADPIGNKMAHGGKIDKALKNMSTLDSDLLYADGGNVGDCIPCRQKAENGMEIELEIEPKSDKLDIQELNRVLGKFGYEAIKKGEYPIGKIAAGMSIDDISWRHRYPVNPKKKSFELGIKTEMEHTTDKKIAEKISLDHLYADAEYYQKLQKIEKLYAGSEIDYDFNPMGEYVENSDGRTEMKLYLHDVKVEANNVLFSDERKLSKGIICMAKINQAKEAEKLAASNLEKNFWQENINIWKNCMMLVENGGYARMMNVKNPYYFQDFYTYAKGGLAYGNSHTNGGIPLYNKGAASMIEIEGGEGVVKKESMQMKKPLEFQGKKMSACEIVSEINQMTGGVKFKCADVKKIMENDGNYQ